jgi:hypothetical protein
MRKRHLLSAVLIVLGGLSSVQAADPPAYQIFLRSRRAEVVPTRTKDAQTGGGSIVVEQPAPNTIVVTMAGSVVVGSDCHGSSAEIDFNFVQDFDIVPLRKGVRPPRVGLVGRVVGTVQVTDPKCCKPCGSAEQGIATAALGLGDTSLLSINVPATAASCGQMQAVNNRDGPVECPAVAGCYHLTGAFHISANQGKGVFNRQYAVADFDPAPQLDGFWGDALKPFRAVPRGEFGFKIVVRVIEDDAPEAEK